MTARKTILTLLALFVLGCSRQGAKIEIGCPAPSSKQKIIAQMEQRRRDLIEFGAKGNATAHFVAEGRTESMNNVTIYFTDRQNVMIRIGHAFGTAISLGCNAEDFWFLVNFGKINDYYGGKIAMLDDCGPRGIKTFPVAEALGIVDVESLKAGKLVVEADEYAIEVAAADGAIQKSYYFDNCTGNLTRIIYYEEHLAAVVAEFADYKTLNGNMTIPTTATIFAIKDNMRLDFNITRFVPLSLDSRRRQKLYSTPNPSADANRFLLNNLCEFAPIEDSN